MEGNDISSEQKYMKKNIIGLFEKMTINILEDKPKDVVKYMIDWLDQKGETYVKMSKKNKNKIDGFETSSSDGEDEEEEEIAPLSDNKYSIQKINRTSVSAEVFGEFNKKKEFIPKIIEKDDETKKKILDLLNKNFLFSNLDPNEKNIIISAMERRVIVSESIVIKEGEEGENMFIVFNGSLSCYKEENGKDILIKSYEEGDHFGELALLYNCRRSATIISNKQSILYSIDRDCFNNIVRDAVIRNKEKYEKFLSSVEILSTLNSSEISKLCDCLEIEVFEKDDLIIREGDIGDKFYIVVNGNAKAMKISEISGKSEFVKEYSEKMYFGELSLIRDEPRAASIIAEVYLIE